jgi:hypothetical protein
MLKTVGMLLIKILIGAIGGGGYFYHKFDYAPRSAGSSQE